MKYIEVLTSPLYFIIIRVTQEKGGGVLTLNLLTVEEAAEVLRCSQRFVLNEIDRGNIKARKIGKGYKILQEELESYVKEGAEQKEEAQETPQGILEGLKSVEEAENKPKSSERQENQPEEDKEQPDPEYYTPGEIAELEDLSKRTIQKYCKDGTIPEAYKDGRRWKIPADYTVDK